MKPSYADILKFDESKHPRDEDGEFTSTDGPIDPEREARMKARGIERRKERKARAARMAQARREAGGPVGAKQRARDFQMARGRAQMKIIRAIRERKD